jgi:DNA-binding GntR family transcriptional regulator
MAPVRHSSKISASRAAPSASETAYGMLHDAIVDCTIPPGTRFTQDELETRTGLGKTPVREALQRLVKDGLVRVAPRKGYRVTEVTERDVEELCALRLLVEPRAAVLAAERGLSADQVAALTKLARVGYEVADPASMRAFHRANRAFHATIASACGNARMAQLVDQLLAESQRMIQFGLMLAPHSESAVHDHKALVAALRRKDTRRTRQLVEQEIRATRAMILESLSQAAASAG